MPAELFEGIYFLEGNGFDCNSLLIKGKKSALIDPGFGKEKELLGLRLSFDSIGLILLTHCHADHFSSAHLFRKAKIMASKPDALKLEKKDLHATASDFFKETVFPDVTAFNENEISSGRHSLKVIETPGHTSGSVSFFFPSLKLLACGDLLFFQGVGRTDLPSGSQKQLVESIMEIEKLGLEIIVPGHGPLIQGRQAIKENFDCIKAFF